MYIDAAAVTRNVRRIDAAAATGIIGTEMRRSTAARVAAEAPELLDRVQAFSAAAHGLHEGQRVDVAVALRERRGVRGREVARALGPRPDIIVDEFDAAPVRTRPLQAELGIIQLRVALAFPEHVAGVALRRREIRHPHALN